MSAFNEDFWAVEPCLIQRLQAACPLARAVLSAADFAGVEEKNQITPALHVFSDGFSPVNGDEIVQQWLVVAVTRNLRQANLEKGNDFRVNSDSGRLVAQVIRALRYFNPLPGDLVQPLLMAAPPKPVLKNGFFYVPTVWTAHFKYTRERR